MKLHSKYDNLDNLFEKIEKNLNFNIGLRSYSLTVLRPVNSHRRAIDYQQKIKNLLFAFENNNVLVSPKVHYLVSHVDKFPLNCGLEGEERGELFHQTIKRLLNRFKDNLIGMIGYYCWAEKKRNSNVFDKCRKPENYFSFK